MNDLLERTQCVLAGLKADNRKISITTQRARRDSEPEPDPEAAPSPTSLQSEGENAVDKAALPSPGTILPDGNGTDEGESSLENTPRECSNGGKLQAERAPTFDEVMEMLSLEERAEFMFTAIENDYGVSPTPDMIVSTQVDVV